MAHQNSPMLMNVYDNCSALPQNQFCEIPDNFPSPRFILDPVGLLLFIQSALDHFSATEETRKSSSSDFDVIREYIQPHMALKFPTNEKLVAGYSKGYFAVDQQFTWYSFVCIPRVSDRLTLMSWISTIGRSLCAIF